MKDYSDAYMFSQTQVFNDTRSLVKAPARNYACYAPTGQYPQPPGEAATAFSLGDHEGAKLYFVCLRVADAANLLIDGSPIQPGDQLAIMPMGSTDAVGLGRIGQGFEWDGIHDMIIEVLGGSNTAEAKGGLLDGNAWRLAIYDKSSGGMDFVEVQLAGVGTSFSFNPKRPASRSGAIPLTTDHAANTYATGAISLITGFDNRPIANCQDLTVQLDDNGFIEIAASDVDDGSSDHSGSIMLDIAPSTFDCSMLGTNSVLLTVTDDSGASATCTSGITIERNSSTACIWKGAVDTDWFNAGNWSHNCLPALSDHVLIPNGMPNDPHLVSGTSRIATLEVEFGASLTIDGVLHVEHIGGDPISNTGMIQVNGMIQYKGGNFINNGLIKGNGVILEAD
jgi:hypothetical protein